MKYLAAVVVILASILAPPPSIYAAQTASANLSWDSNTEADMAKYIMHMGTVSGVYTTTIDVPHTALIPRQSGKFLNLTDGQTYFFSVTAMDTSGNISGFATEVSKSISIPPGVPGNMDVTIDINISITVP